MAELLTAQASLAQCTWVQFPVPIRATQNYCNSRSRIWYPLLAPTGIACTYTYISKHLHKIKIHNYLFLEALLLGMHEVSWEKASAQKCWARSLLSLYGWFTWHTLALVLAHSELCPYTLLVACSPGGEGVPVFPLSILMPLSTSLTVLPLEFLWAPYKGYPEKEESQHSQGQGQSGSWEV